MITKEQIELVAHHYSHVWDEYDAFVAGAEWSLEQCPYSKEDMINFAEFCIHQFNVCDSFGNWYHEWGEKDDTKTTQQLLKEYEE